MKRFFTLMMIVAALFAGCREKHEGGGGDNTPAFELSEDSFSFSNAGRTVSVNVSSKHNWTAETAEEWIALRVADENAEEEFASFISGRAGASTVEIEIAENPTADIREGVVTFTTIDMETFTVSVTQDSAPDRLDIEEVTADDYDEATNTLHFAAASGEASIKFTTLRDWTAVVADGAAWCAVTPASGKGGNASVTVTVQPANTTDERSTEITLVSGEVSVTFTVEQEAMDWIELDDVTADDWNKATKTMHFTIAGGEATVNFTVTRGWTASVTENADWCTVTPEEGNGGQASITINVANADGREERKAEVTLESGDVTVTLTVMQDGLDWIDFAEDKDFDSDTNTLRIAAAGGDKSFSFTTSGDWTAKVADGQDWCSISPESGTAPDGTITISVQPVGDEPRSTTITITCGETSETFTVEQALPSEMELRFPDPVFREYVLKKYDRDQDGTLSTEEAEAVTEMYIYGNYDGIIYSFQGIEFFTNAIKLGLSGHGFTTLDLSQNTKLERLTCNENDNMIELNLSGCSALISLTCQKNPLLPMLDVSQTNLGGSSELAPLYCNNNSSLTVIYLKTGWTINGVYPSRNTFYIDKQTNVEFK